MPESSPADRAVRWQEYADTVLLLQTPLGDIRVRPGALGRTSGDFPDPDGRTIHVITAHNPRGQVADEETNRDAQAQLEAEV